MKVTLIYPPLVPGVRAKYGLQPLGVLYLASRLKAMGAAVRVIDGEILGMTVDEIAAEVVSSGADLAGISAMTPQYPVALAIARELKKRDPGLRVCMGGAHVNATRDEALRHCDSLDFVVYGEGEETLAEVAGKLGRGEDISGVSGTIHRKNGVPTQNPPRPFILDLDGIPFPDFRMIPLPLYRIPYLRKRPIGSMMLSRGCPYRCAFCDAHVTQGKRLRKHSPSRIVEELAFCARDLGIRSFAFKDSTFTLDRAWCIEMLERLRGERLGIGYRCNTRVDRIDAGLAEALKSSGCTMILFGVESGSQAVLDRMNKAITVKQVREAFRLTSVAGIRTYASFMIGNLGETPATARETIELAKAINPDLVLFFFTTAYPGTELYGQALREGLVRRDWWIKEAPDGREYAFSKWLSGEGGKLRLEGFDTTAWIKRAYRGFYFRPRYVWKVLKELIRHPLYITTLLSVFPGLFGFFRSKGGKASPVQLEEVDEC